MKKRVSDIVCSRADMHCACVVMYYKYLSVKMPACVRVYMQKCMLFVCSCLCLFVLCADVCVRVCVGVGASL